MKIKIFLIIFLTFISFFSFADKFNFFKNFPVDTPLSYKAFRTIKQDSSGFMWFGSQEGAHRYDGNQFLTFHHDENDPNSLSSDLISRIMIDNTEQIWIATHGGGINLYRENTKDFIRINSKTNHLSLTDDTVNALMEDNLGNVWVGTNNGLSIIERVKQQWTIKHIFKQEGNNLSLSHNTVNTIIQISKNEIWIGTNGVGISAFDLQGNFIKMINITEPNSDVDIDRLIKSLFKDNQGNVWIGTIENGLIKYSLETHKYVHYRQGSELQSSIVSNTIEAIFQDSQGRVWIGTDKGLMIYNHLTNEFNRITHSATNAQSLSNNYVVSFYEDDSNLLWIGTFSGVSIWDPTMTSFNQYNDERYTEIASSLIMDFSQQNKQQILFSTYAEGLYSLSEKGDSISPFEYNYLLKGRRITSHLIDDNILWVGTRSYGLYKIDLNTGDNSHYQHNINDIESISANSVTDIFKDSKGQIWISTYHKGLNLHSNGLFTRFEPTIPISNKGPSTNHILQISEDHQGDLWLATYGGGINKFNADTSVFTHILHDNNTNNSLSSNVAWFIFKDKDHNLWIGTQSAGINFLSKENIINEDYSFKHLDLKDGMRGLSVYAIAQDTSDRLWYSSTIGISNYSAKSGHFKHFDTRHGLINLEYNYGAVFNRGDSILFGSSKGFTGVNFDNVVKDQIAPIVRMTDIHKLNEVMVFDTSLSQLKSLTFDYDDQLVSFDYVGLNYRAPNSTRYKYRLLGFDKEWIDAGKARRATYTNLPQGNFTLQIIAGNTDDIWSEPYELEVIMNPAPWNTWWAYLCYAVFIALFLLAYSRQLNKKLVIEQQQKLNLTQQVIAKTKDYQNKNVELEHANKQLENAAIIDKLTGVKSRRYLDIYIEQASQLINQIHQNILPVQRSILPRLYILMVEIGEIDKVSNSQLINFTDLLLYSRNQDDIVIRWSDDTFAIIGYEKANNVSDLASRLSNRSATVFKEDIAMTMAYSFYPFNREQPIDITWDQISVMIELGLQLVRNDDSVSWVGLCAPKIQPFNYVNVMQHNDLSELKESIEIKQG